MKQLPDTIRQTIGRGGLRRLEIETPSATAEIYLQGAHITQFQPRGHKPVLFMSAKSSFEAGKPIRGGVPICFPWFGPRTDGLPGAIHGFARLAEWRLSDVGEGSDGSVEICFEFTPGDANRREWNHAVTLRYCVAIGVALRTTLEVVNTGNKPVHYEEALHTYLAVSDVRNVGIEGLEGAMCQDRIVPENSGLQKAGPIRITAETDRIYNDTRATCIVTDPGFGRRLSVAKTGSDATVLWNPWIAKAKAMPDFGDDEWPGMLCIETCNVRSNSVTLPPGQSHAMTATVSVH